MHWGLIGRPPHHTTPRRCRLGVQGFGCSRLVVGEVEGHGGSSLPLELPLVTVLATTSQGELFQSYYEEVWNSAIPLKEGDRVYQEKIDKIFKNKT